MFKLIVTLHSSVVFLFVHVTGGSAKVSQHSGNRWFKWYVVNFSVPCSYELLGARALLMGRRKRTVPGCHLVGQGP
jgi:hypothetical protein